MSIMPRPLPSRCAAMPRIAPMVTTPVPPTPVTMTLKVRSMAGIAGSGSGLNVTPSVETVSGTAFFDLGAMHRHEGRAEAVHAGEVLVAVRLVDLALAAELGLDRLHGDAVRLHRAIAAGLADEIVDDDALVRIRELAALAAAALLRRAGLVVDHHRHAGDFRELGAARHRARRGDGSSCRTASGSPSGYLSGSSVTSAMRSTPSSRTCRAIMSTVSPPSCGCPPVMATASLKRIL